MSTACGEGWILPFPSTLRARRSRHKRRNTSRTRKKKASRRIYGISRRNTTCVITRYMQLFLQKPGRGFAVRRMWAFGGSSQRPDLLLNLSSGREGKTGESSALDWMYNNSATREVFFRGLISSVANDHDRQDWGRGSGDAGPSRWRNLLPYMGAYFWVNDQPIHFPRCSFPYMDSFHLLYLKDSDKNWMCVQHSLPLN